MERKGEMTFYNDYKVTTMDCKFAFKVLTAEGCSPNAQHGNIKCKYDLSKKRVVDTGWGIYAIRAENLNPQNHYESFYFKLHPLFVLLEYNEEDVLFERNTKRELTSKDSLLCPAQTEIALRQANIVYSALEGEFWKNAIQKMREFEIKKFNLYLINSLFGRI